MIIVLLMLTASGGLLFHYFENPQKFEEYTIHGFDVSHHQGEIDWKKIDKKYQFVFIKATEGGDFKDPRFTENWKNAKDSGLKVGAYHFFRNCKTGLEQAQNYIDAVPKQTDSLPPVMDLEFQWNCPDVTAEQLQTEIATMAKTLESHYGKKPIFYTTPNYYQSYIKGKFDDHVLWIQDLKEPPPRFDQRPWLFWQYSQKGKISGIEKEVDLNVFRGTTMDFDVFLQSNNTVEPHVPKQ